MIKITVRYKDEGELTMDVTKFKEKISEMEYITIKDLFESFDVCIITFSGMPLKHINKDSYGDYGWNRDYVINNLNCIEISEYKRAISGLVDYTFAFKNPESITHLKLKKTQMIAMHHPCDALDSLVYSMSFVTEEYAKEHKEHNEKIKQELNKKYGYKGGIKAISSKVDFDPVKNPSHYVEGRQYEPRKVIADWDLNFNLGNAVKYIARAGKKENTKGFKAGQIEDLRKAIQYIEFEIEELGGKKDE